MRRARFAIALFLPLAALPAAAAPFVAPPAPARWVTDEAGFLSEPAREALDARLGAYQRQSGHQVLLWIGRTTGGVPIEDFTVRTFEAWKVGRKGMDDGLALFILVDDRKARFEVGYGLEGNVPDLIASRILREIVIPRIQAGDRDGAAAAGMEAAIAAIEGRPFDSAGSGEPLATDFTARAAPRGPPAQPIGLGTKILFAILGIAFLILLITHPSLALYLLFNLLSGGRGGGGGGGDGGFSGGGGRSGGGGATGSW
ncbi:MAG TPA: TPM domain-containing protein [Thermoanaerobaculia bacterium]